MILRAHSIDLPVLDVPIDYELEHRPAIEANWRDAVAKQPRLWNGVQFLFRNVRIEDGVLRGTGYRSDYAAFLYWRAHRHEIGDRAAHIAATALPIMTDGGLLTVRMAAPTANAGNYYFPAGSLDGDDVIDGRLSIDHNIARELSEETGIEADFTNEPYIIAIDRGAWHVARRTRIAMGVEKARAHIQQHQMRTGDDETDGVFGVFNVQDAQRLKTYARMLAEWHFMTVSAETAA